MAKLAIKGHPTRGKEIIKILEMLGGKYIPYPNGTVADLVYYIRSEGWIDNMHEVSSADYIVFTLEEFIEKFPFKVGDKVIVKGYKQVFEILSMRWCSERNDVLHSVSNGWFYTEELQPYKEEIMEDSVNHPKHYISHPSGVECITITRHYCFAIGNAIKYLWRAGLKKELGLSDKLKEIEDLNKAIWYIKDRIKQLTNGLPKA